MSPGTITCVGCGTAMAAYKATCPRCGMPTARPATAEPAVLPVVPLTLPPSLVPTTPEPRRRLPVSAVVLAPMALLLLVVVFLIGRHSGGSSSSATPGTGARIAAAAAVGHASPTITPQQPTVATATQQTDDLVAHGHVLSARPADGRCPLEGDTLLATGDDGSPIGATQLHGEPSKDGCTYAFYFPVTPTIDVTFHLDSYTVVGPDGHDGQVYSTALKKDLVLHVR